MKCLTVRQPWANLIALGAKNFETRSWSTRYRGRIGIHAGKKWDYAMRRLWLSEPFFSAARLGELPPFEWAFGNPVLGKIICTATLVEVYPVETLTNLSDQERAFGDYSPGRFAWELRDIELITPPVPAKGRLGLWNWDETEKAA